jgi:hypothetical protein
MKKVKPEGGFRNSLEKNVPGDLARVFARGNQDLPTKLDNFTKYIRRQRLTRLLALYEIFKRVLPIKGSIVECGVYHGFSLMAWANISAILEPANLTRRIYGFDSFKGFPSTGAKDKGQNYQAQKGHLQSDSFNELQQLIKIYDDNRFLGHVSKVQLISGDIVKTVPEFIKKNQHLMISLLFLDMDLYEPTRAAIQAFYSRIPKGGIIAFDELDNPIWPGETTALMEMLGIGKLRIERVDFDPYIGFAVVE